MVPDVTGYRRRQLAQATISTSRSQSAGPVINIKKTIIGWPFEEPTHLRTSRHIQCNEATLVRYRISRAWPLDHGRLLAPSGTVINSNSDDKWSRCARGLTPPWDAQALDDEAYQRMLRSYPAHRHLVRPPPLGEQTDN